MQGSTTVQRIVDLTLRTTSDTKGVDNFTRSAEEAGIVFDKVGKEANEAAKGVDNFEKEVVQTTTRTQRLGAGLQRGVTRLRNFRNAVRQNREELRGANSQFGNLARTLAAGIGFGIAIKGANDFSIAIAEISTLVDTAEVSNKQLRDTVIELSSEFGIGTTDVAKALYQAISSGAVQASDANEFLNTSLRLARAGLVDAEQAVDGLTTVLNAYNLPAEEAGRVSDILFATVRAGKTDLQQLSQFLFQAVPIAATLGVSFEEVNASLVALTASGTPTRVAFTQIRAAMQGLVRPTEDLTEIFQDAGFESGEAAIKAVGFQAALQVLEAATGGSVSQLQELLGSVEAVQGVLGITGQNAERFSTALEDVTNSAGATDEAFEKVNETIGVKSQVAITSVSNALTTLGEAFEPIIRVFLRFVTTIADAVVFLGTEFPAVLTTFVTALTGLLIFNQVRRAAQLFRGTLKFLVPQMVAATGATEGQAAAQAILNPRLATTALILGKITAALALVTLGYELATAVIDGLIQENDKALAELKKTFDIQRDILELRQQLAAQRGVSEEEIFEQIQPLIARAFAQGIDEDTRRERLNDVRELLQQELSDIQSVNAQIKAGEAEIRNFALAAEEEKRAARRQSAIDQTNANILIAQQEITLARATKKEQEKLAKDLAKLEKEIAEDSRDFQKSIAEDIAAQGRELLGVSEEEDPAIANARRILAINKEIAEQRRVLASSVDAASAREAQTTIQALRDEALQAETAAQRFVLLQRIQEAEEEAARIAGQRAALEGDTATTAAKSEQERLDAQKKRIEDLKTVIKDIDKPIEISVDVQIESAQNKVDFFKRALDDIKSRRIVITADVQETGQAGGVMGAFASGGNISAGRRIPGYGGGDRVNFTGERGEWVINKRRSSEFAALLNRINSGSRASVQRMIDTMAGAKPRFQEGGVLGSIGALAAQTGAPASSEQIVQRVALDLSLGSRPMGTLFGEEAVINNLIDTLRDGRRGVVRK